MDAEPAEQPVDPPTQATRSDQRPHQFGGEASERSPVVTAAACSGPTASPVEPLAQVTQLVGIKTAVCSNTEKIAGKPAFAARRRGTMGAPLVCRESQIARKRTLSIVEFRARIMSRGISLAEEGDFK